MVSHRTDPALRALSTIEHRPWPLPARPWIMRQTWHELLFAHWPISPERMRPLIPSSLELDTFNGMCWLGIVPFRMSGIRRRGWPALPGHSALPELNVRTYVRSGRQAGVWFFSLDAGHAAAVWAARRFFHLPYYRARIRCRRMGERIEYSSRRTHRGAAPAAFEAVYGPSGTAAQAAPGTIEHWLTERYCLYTTAPRGELLRGEIHHRPWPLRPASAEFALNSMSAPLGLELPDCPPILQYAERLDVVIWPLEAGCAGE